MEESYTLIQDQEENIADEEVKLCSYMEANNQRLVFNTVFKKRMPATFALILLIVTSLSVNIILLCLAIITYNYFKKSDIPFFAVTKLHIFSLIATLGVLCWFNFHTIGLLKAYAYGSFIIYLLCNFMAFLLLKYHFNKEENGKK
jgi:TRAP-type C4-dicarboxylate transport system permease small subunit